MYPDEKPAPSYAWLDSYRRWRTVIERDSDLKRHFKAQLEYPELQGKEFDALNSFVRDKMVGILKRFREDFVYGPDADDPQYLMPVHYELTASFVIELLHSNLVSIRFTIHSFAGGAHGSTRTEPASAILDPFTPLRLASLFPDLPKGVADLSNFCILLKSQPYPRRDEKWVKTGAGPKASNFASFNLTSAGLLVTFMSIRSTVTLPDEVKCSCLTHCSVTIFDSRIRSELFKI